MKAGLCLGDGRRALIPPPPSGGLATTWLFCRRYIQQVVQNGVVAGVSECPRTRARASVRMGGDLCFMRTAGTARELVDAFH